MSSTAIEPVVFAGSERDAGGHADQLHDDGAATAVVHDVVAAVDVGLRGILPEPAGVNPAGPLPLVASAASQK